MSLLSWLFFKAPPAACKLATSGDHWFPIVGESYYQIELERLSGGKTEDGVAEIVQAELLHEPNNKYDRNAVAVLINGRKVGHLGRADAVEFLAAMQRYGVAPRAICGALICGGWRRPDGDEGHFGVKLDVQWPPELASN